MSWLQHTTVSASEHLTFHPSSAVKTIISSLSFPATSFSEFLPNNRATIFVSFLGTSSFWDLQFQVFCKFLLGLTITHKHSFLIVDFKSSFLTTTLLSRVLIRYFQVSFKHPYLQFFWNLKLNIMQTDFSCWRSKAAQFNT